MENKGNYGPQSTCMRATPAARQSDPFSEEIRGSIGGFSGQRPLESRPGNPEPSSGFAHRQTPNFCNPLVGVSRSGRPSLWPCALARARPATTRSCNSSVQTPRSATDLELQRPLGVVVSIPPKGNERYPSAWSSSSSRMRCRRFRPAGPAPARQDIESPPTSGLQTARRGLACGPSRQTRPCLRIRLPSTLDAPHTAAALRAGSRRVGQWCSDASVDGRSHRAHLGRFRLVLRMRLQNEVTNPLLRCCVNQRSKHWTDAKPVLR